MAVEDISWERSFRESAAEILRQAAWALVSVETTFGGGRVGDTLELSIQIDSLSAVIENAEWLMGQLESIDGEKLTQELVRANHLTAPQEPLSDEAVRVGQELAERLDLH